MERKRDSKLRGEEVVNDPESDLRFCALNGTQHCHLHQLFIPRHGGVEKGGRGEGTKSSGDRSHKNEGAGHP